MFITKDDFVIRAENFNFTKEINLLRFICGAFMFPHALSKLTAGGFNPGVVAFFTKAGLQPPELWITLALIAEASTGVALVLGLCTRWAALGAAGALAVAVYALQMANGFGWLWNKGGYEYPIFWGIACLVVAIHEFRKHPL